MANILAVDDEDDMLETIAYNLERAGHGVMRARGAGEALQHLAEATPDLIISDVMMPGMDGLAFCAAVRSRPATALTPFLFVTGKGQASDRYAGLRAGADDYVTKPFDLADLLARVEARLEHRLKVVAIEADIDRASRRWLASDEPAAMAAASEERARLADEVVEAGFVDYEPPLPDAAELRSKVARLEERFPALGDLRRRVLVGEAPAFLRIFEEILMAAASPDPTLVLGETGTGKTAVAEAVRALGPRRQGPFRTVNCSELAAGDPTIATGKLFGYGKGSGLANVPREGQPGLLEETDGGVLFLDEVAELPHQAQVLLLLPLERRPFNPAVGRGEARRVDVKFVCATNRDLAEEVEARQFPRDLFERLAGHVIHLPPLRARPEDVVRLTTHFLDELAAEQSAAPVAVAPAAGEVLRRYLWPGNARELRRTVRQAAQRALLAGRSAIERQDLPPELLARATPPPTPGARPDRAAVEPLARADFTEAEQRELAALRATGFRVGEAETLLGFSTKSRTLSHRLRGLEYKALDATGCDPERGAQLLVPADPALRPTVVRRLEKALDHAQRNLDQPERILALLRTEHRRHALAVMAYLRVRS